MSRVAVKYETLLDDDRRTLLARTAGVMEIHRNSGHRIVGVVTYETIAKYGLTLFFEVDLEAGE